MPSTHSLREIEQMMNQTADYYDTAYALHRAHIPGFVDFANPQPGEHVLDMGTGAGWVLIEAKKRVGNGVCVGLDTAKELLKKTAKPAISQAGLSYGKEAPEDKRVRLIRADIMDRDSRKYLLDLLPAGVFGYDLITCLWTFHMIPKNRRLATLDYWASLLAPGGRIVLDYNLEVEDAQCPATLIRQQAEHTGGTGGIRMRPVRHDQVAPDRLWQLCREQIETAVPACNLRVVEARDAHKQVEAYGPFGSLSKKYEEEIEKLWLDHGKGRVGEGESMPDEWLVAMLAKMVRGLQEPALNCGPLDCHTVAVLVDLRKG